MADAIYQQVSAEVKTAMKARDKDRVAALRLIMAEFKRVEVDERIELDDERVLQILDKMTKQRKDSHQQYVDAGRDDLADKEALEMSIISEFLPAQLSDDELEKIIDAAVAEVGASAMQDMGKVMGIVKPQVQGRADMGAVSGLVKAKLG
ncbi:MAG: GatB/YqeY domain-containing protein [Pseudomonadales bacterium]|nr:GatB/YqeY domain-containing protein [Pseudomonadales bacterium]MBO6565516.1 GatB/YqeY domain-containing protein [Pseudomonadales bacterium]MBO6594197.1 GatB/YqeY domain-containing protein [Pseudomonadales bacterium]MBO6656340.1 GatB/YqeY domain-containing protein [Pseudomonadales bacterium]MBO6700696.1 GatB/YqeY domain-containing protein [Pseudomonadales bacterium]